MKQTEIHSQPNKNITEFKNVTPNIRTSSISHGQWNYMIIFIHDLANVYVGVLTDHLGDKLSQFHINYAIIQHLRYLFQQAQCYDISRLSFIAICLTCILSRLHVKHMAGVFLEYSVSMFMMPWLNHCILHANYGKGYATSMQKHKIYSYRWMVCPATLMSRKKYLV